MKKSCNLLAALFHLVLIGCPASTEGVPHSEESSAVSGTITGTYQGLLPCADCEKISYRLELKPDGSYASPSTYIGRSDRAFEASGTYTLSQDGIVVLDKKDDGMNYFKKHPDGLLMLDSHAQEINGALAGRYILTSMPQDPQQPVEGQSQDFLYNLWAKGIDFYARGNEPFWSLDMDFDKQFQFSALNDLKLTTPPTEGVKTLDGRKIQYPLNAESADMIVSASAQACTDTMSGERFDYKVEVEVRPAAAKTYRNFSGCGNYVPDMRLTDIWVVEQVEDTKLRPASFMKGLPTLELSARDRRLNGHDGCNRIGGAFSTQRNTITFKQIISTRMFCPMSLAAPDIGALLSEKTYDFEFGNNRLYLKKNNTNIVILKHVD